MNLFLIGSKSEFYNMHFWTWLNISHLSEMTQINKKDLCPATEDSDLYQFSFNVH